MKEIVVIGGGGHAKSVIAILKKINDYKLLGYTDITDKGILLGLNYLGVDEVLEKLLREHLHCAAAIGIGIIHQSRKREEIVNYLEGLGFELPALISPHAIVNEGVNIGKGTVVMDGVVINSGSHIGEGAIINTNSTVEHDCQIGDYVHIASGATLGGDVRVGNYTIIGTGVSVIQSITISENCVIGAGAAVVKDCVKEGTYIGVPARIKK